MFLVSLLPWCSPAAFLAGQTIIRPSRVANHKSLCDLKSLKKGRDPSSKKLKAILALEVSAGAFFCFLHKKI